MSRGKEKNPFEPPPGSVFQLVRVNPVLTDEDGMFGFPLPEISSEIDFTWEEEAELQEALKRAIQEIEARHNKGP